LNSRIASMKSGLDLMGLSGKQKELAQSAEQFRKIREELNKMLLAARAAGNIGQANQINALVDSLPGIQGRERSRILSESGVQILREVFQNLQKVKHTEEELLNLRMSAAGVAPSMRNQIRAMEAERQQLLRNLDAWKEYDDVIGDVISELESTASGLRRPITSLAAADLRATPGAVRGSQEAFSAIGAADRQNAAQMLLKKANEQREKMLRKMEEEIRFWKEKLGNTVEIKGN